MSQQCTSTRIRTAISRGKTDDEIAAIVPEASRGLIAVVRSNLRRRRNQQARARLQVKTTAVLVKAPSKFGEAQLKKEGGAVVSAEADRMLAAYRERHPHIPAAWACSVVIAARERTAARIDATSSANAVQVGGTHYKDKGLQPWDAIVMWGMGFLDGNALKYLVRFRNKGGVEDLRKARHYIDKLIEVETKGKGV